MFIHTRGSATKRFVRFGRQKQFFCGKKEKKAVIVCLTRVWQSLLPLFVTKRSSFPSKLAKHVRSSTTYMCKHIAKSSQTDYTIASSMPICSAPLTYGYRPGLCLYPGQLFLILTSIMAFRDTVPLHCKNLSSVR